MVTRAPPERTSGAERSRISPPITSNTMSDLADVFQPIHLQIQEGVGA